MDIDQTRQQAERGHAEAQKAPDVFPGGRLGGNSAGASYWGGGTGRVLADPSAVSGALHRGGHSAKSVPPKSQPLQAAESLPTMLQAICEVFGLNNAQIARMAGVSPSALHGHLASGENLSVSETVGNLHHLAARVHQEVGASVRSGLTSMIVEGKTLLDHLEASEKQPDQIVAICQRIADWLAERGEIKPVSDAIQRATVREAGRYCS